MATIVEYTISPQDGSFRQAQTEFPDREIEIERIKLVDDVIRVYFWVRPTPTDFLENGGHSHFESLTHLDTVGTESLFQTDWPATQESVLNGI